MTELKTEATATLAKNIKRLRTDKGWTQKILAEKSGFHAVYINNLESGEHWISADGVSKIASALGCKPPDLFSDPDSETMPINDLLKTLASMKPGFFKEFMKINWDAKGVLEWLRAGVKKFPR